MKILLQKFLISFLLLGLCSCATIFSGRRQSVFVESYPADALITRNGEYLGRTPAVIAINRRSNEPLELTKEGYAPQIIQVRRNVNPLVFLNFGNPLGYKIDLVTGSFLKFDKNYYIRSLCLQAEQQVTNEVTIFPGAEVLPGSIFWSAETKLKEGDFKGHEQGKADRFFAATTASTIDCDYILSDSLSFVRIVSRFSGNASFLKERLKKKEMILRHEQMHFDIMEIYARKIRKQMSITKFEKASFGKQLNTLCFNLIQEMEAYQAFFDEDICNASSADEVEKKWAERIANDLKSLEEYRDVIIRIPFSNRAGS